MPPVGTDSERAVERGQAALRLYESGEWTAAYHEFAIADGLAHSPVFSLFMARCLRNSGRWLAARQGFVRLLAEKLSASAPGPWVNAVESARTELGTLEAEIPSISFQVPAGTRGPVKVLLDGRTITEAELKGSVKVDPGTHVAVLEGQKGPLVTEAIAVRVGQKGSVVRLVVPEQASPRGREGAAEQPIAAPPRSQRSSETVAAYAALGLGVVAVGVGAVTGWVALRSANEIKRNCAGSHCLPSDETRAANANDLGRISTIGFAVGGVSLATGLTLLVAAPRGYSSPPARAAASELGVVATGRF
jgi:hypothetical protein